MRNVNEHRVSKPTPRNRVSVLFVFSIALMLTVIGSSAWVYLNHDRDFSPKVISAVAAIEAPLVLPDPVSPENEKLAPAKQIEMASVDVKSEVAQQKLAEPVVEKEAPSLVAESIEKNSEEIVGMTTASDPQPTVATPAPRNPPVLAETKSAPAEPEIITIFEPAAPETQKTNETYAQTIDTPKIAEGTSVTDDKLEIANAEPEQIETPVKVSDEEPSISAQEMLEIMTVEPAAGPPVPSEVKTQPDTNITDTQSAPPAKDTEITVPATPAAEEPSRSVPDETVTAAEAGDPVTVAEPSKDPKFAVANPRQVQTVTSDAQEPALTASPITDEAGDPVTVAEHSQDPKFAVANPTQVQTVTSDAQEPALTASPITEPEAPSETVVAALETTTEQPAPNLQVTRTKTPAWLDEAPALLPVRGTVEMALVLPPSQPSYAVLAPETPDVREEKPVEPEPKKAAPFVEPMVLTLPPANEPLWQKNAQPFEDAENRPRIAIIISEMGTSKAGTTAAIDHLPAAVTLAFNPYGQRLQSWIDKSREKGHEVLLQLPMEPISYPRIDPGPHALLTSLTPEENFEHLNWSLDRFSGYTGLTNQMGSKFTASRPHIEPVLAVLKEKGLLYVDSRTASNSVAAKIAKELSIPVALNNRFLDHRADAETLDARLTELETIAFKSGSAIGIGYPHPATLERLATWTASLASKGIVLAPISALVNRQDIK